MTRTTLALGIALGLAMPGSAAAYVIQETSGGDEIRFRALPQEFLLAEEGSADVAGIGELEALARAFGSWADVPDSDARFSGLAAVDMDESDIFVDDGLPGRDRKNLVAWVETGWQEDASLIALTYTYYVEATGKLLEDDIAMNGENYTWTVGDTGVLTDVESIAAHEIGHAFGLGHCDDAGSPPADCPDATMFSTSSQGETHKRSLGADDMAAIRHLYPPGCCPITRTQEALAFFGCSSAPGTARGGALAALALLAGAGVTAVLRKRNARGAALAAALLTLPLAASTANATMARALSVDELSRQAATVVRGTVIWTEAMTLQGGAIVTLTEIEVEDVIAGDAPATITVVEPGGEPGDGVGLKVSGTARFEVGEEVVLFASTAKSAYQRRFPGAMRPLGMSQGKLRVVREPGAPARVVRELGGLARLAADGMPAADELSGLTLDELVDRVVRAR